MCVLWYSESSVRLQVFCQQRYEYWTCNNYLIIIIINGGFYMLHNTATILMWKWKGAQQIVRPIAQIYLLLNSLSVHAVLPIGSASRKWNSEFIVSTNMKTYEIKLFIDQNGNHWILCCFYSKASELNFNAKRKYFT